MSRGRELITEELRTHGRGLALGVGIGLLWAAARVAVPYLVKQAIDQGISGRDTGALIRWTAAVVAAGLVSAACAGGRRYVAFRQARSVEAGLRNRMFAHVQGLDWAYFDRSSAGDLMSRSNGDLLQIQNFLNMIPLTLSNAAQVAAVTVILVTLNPLLALCALGSLPLVNVLGRRFSQRLHPSMTGIQRASARVAAVVEETVAGTRVVKGLGAEPVQQARLDTEADGLYHEAMTAVGTRSRYVPALELLPNIGLLLVVAVGGHQVIGGALSLGALVAFNVYVNQLIWPLRSLGFVIAMAQRALAAAERVAEVLDATPAVADPSDPQPLPSEPPTRPTSDPASAAAGTVVPPRSIQHDTPQFAGNVNGASNGAVNGVGHRQSLLGEVRFEGVGFAYPTGGTHRVLDGFDLTVTPGETVALVGATGSGKSTVPRLLARFYDVDQGRILIDGVDVRRVPLAQLRRAVGIVFEESFLFTDSIAANIAFADPDADPAVIHRAAQLAGAADFIDALPHGYDTEVGERGYSLSGGQRQRLAIARALVAEPRILVLDDATSAIDPTKEREILAGLAAVGGRRTTLVISHRPATIALADRVVFIDDGRVAATGPHDDLLATSPRYREVLAAALGEVA